MSIVIVIVSTTTKPVSIIVVISRTPAIVCRISHFNQTMPTLALDLESSSMCCYLALVERLRDGTTKSEEFDPPPHFRKIIVQFLYNGYGCIYARRYEGPIV